MRQSLLTFTLLLAGAVDLAGQGSIHALTPIPQVQTFSLTWVTQSPVQYWLRLNTATGQLYELYYGETSQPTPVQTTVNGSSLLAPTDTSIPGRFALFPAG